MSKHRIVAVYRSRDADVLASYRLIEIQVGHYVRTLEQWSERWGRAVVEWKTFTARGYEGLAVVPDEKFTGDTALPGWRVVSRGEHARRLLVPDRRTRAGKEIAETLESHKRSFEHQRTDDLVGMPLALAQRGSSVMATWQAMAHGGAVYVEWPIDVEHHEQRGDGPREPGRIDRQRWEPLTVEQYEKETADAE